MDSHSITDPSDFASTSLPSLSDFDSNLRCQVCKELFDTPMLTSCSHTFCSKCIRHCLSADGKCPTCRAQDQTSKLRKNAVVGALVASWTGVRQGVLEAVTKRDNEKEAAAVRAQSTRSKRKSDQEIEERYPKRATRNSRKFDAAAPVVILDSEDDGDANFELEEQHEQPHPEPLQNDGLVPCPICGTRMKEEQVFGHLDICQSTPQPRSKPSITTFPARKKPTYQPLPYMNYHLIKERDLRKKLQELGIPPQGSKAAMEKRHQFWLTIWNANCDSDSPRSKNDLLNELKAWERSQEVKASISIANKDFNSDGWSKDHNNQFKSLIAQARMKAKAEKSAEKEKAEENANAVSPVDLDDVGATQMFKHAVSGATSQNTDDDSLYRGRTPPVRNPNSSMIEANDGNVHTIHMFRVPEDPIKDMQTGNL